MFLAKRTEDQIWSIKTQIKLVYGRTTIVSLNRANLGIKPCEEARNTQDYDQRTHVDSWTRTPAENDNRPQTGHQHLLRVLEIANL